MLIYKTAPEYLILLGKRFMLLYLYPLYLQVNFKVTYLSNFQQKINSNRNMLTFSVSIYFQLPKGSHFEKITNLKSYLHYCISLLDKRHKPQYLRKK